MAIIRSLLDKICSWLVWLTTSMEAIKEQLVSILTSCLTLFSAISKCQNGTLKFSKWHFEKGSFNLNIDKMQLTFIIKGDCNVLLLASLNDISYP